MHVSNYKQYLKWLLRLGVLCGLLWWVTYNCGQPQTRTAALHAMRDIPPNWIDISHDTGKKVDGPTYYCRTRCPAPFLISADYSWASGSLNGGGGRTLYLWFFGTIIQLYQTEHWFA